MPVSVRTAIRIPGLEPNDVRVECVIGRIGSSGGLEETEVVVLSNKSKDGDIAVITINNPPVNALSPGVPEGIEKAIAEIEKDASVKAAVLIGGGRTFIAGADINMFVQMTSGKGGRINLLPTLLRIENCSKPVVVAIHGNALGGGLEVAQACHYRLASPDAKVGQPEVNLGIIPGAGGTQRLPRLVGRGRALEMLLSGEPVTAAEAHRIGLVNHVVPQAELLEFSRQWLRKVLTNAPLALGLTMQAVDVGLEAGLEQGLRFEAAAFGLTTATEDKREGTRAFLEKRPAAFEGK